MSLRAVSLHQQMRSLGYEHHDARLAGPCGYRCVWLTRTRRTDAWVREYNTTRPHQAIAMAVPADRFNTTRAEAERELLPLRLPRSWPWPRLRLGPLTRRQQSRRPRARPSPDSPPGPYHGGPAEFARPVPPSGNMEVLGKQFWLGTGRAGMMVTFWASTEVIHPTIARARIKSVRSHLSAADLAKLAASGGRPAGPPPIPAAEPGAAVKAGRAVSKDGHVSLGGRYYIAAEILGGTMVSHAISQRLMFSGPATRELLRTRPNP